LRAATLPTDCAYHWQNLRHRQQRILGHTSSAPRHTEQLFG
jgi:hypothetical protein